MKEWNVNDNMNNDNMNNDNSNSFDETSLPHVEDLSEEEIYRIVKEDAQNIEPPESLSPRAIEEKLIGVTQNTKRRTSPIVWIAGMAACLVFGVLAGFLTFSMIKSADSGSNTGTSPDVVANADPDVSAAPFTGETYDELTYAGICDIINNYNEENRQYEMIEDGVVYEEAAEGEAADEAAPAAGAESNGDMSKGFQAAGNSRGTDDYSRTDEQVSGVEEGDIVKTDGKYIYTIESSTFGYTLHIVQPNGNQSKEVGSVEIPTSNIREMYVAQNNLITIGTGWGDSKINTTITFIDISNAADPQIRHTLTQSGMFNTSRLSGGYLYTFTEDSFYSDEKYRIDEPRDYVPQINGAVIPAGRIVRAGEEDTNNYMVMTSVPINGDDGFTDTLAVLGGGATYYVSTDHIYIARPSVNSSANRVYWDEYYSPTTALNKYTYTNGIFEKNASTKFRGIINNSYYMHEYNGNFAFVYTSYDGSYEPVNGLCILDGDMNKLGELRKIAPGETIYSSYFIENMAYFVTYRNTDPVFAVDISNPQNPELKSELKLPGFSSYLHSFGPDKLIGIGMGQGSQEGWDGWDGTTKLSLFGINSSYEISELSTAFTEKYARNIAGENHKAIFVDEQRKLIGLGLEMIGYHASEEEVNVENLEFYAVYQVKGDRFVKVLDTSKDRQIGNLLPRETRGVRIGETFYLCNSTGVVRAYTMTDNGEPWKEAP